MNPTPPVRTSPARGVFDAALCGRLFFALAVAVWGAQQMALGKFVRLVPPIADASFPTAPLAIGTGVLLVAAGAALFTRRFAPAGAAVAGALLIANLLLRHVPIVAADPGTGFLWTNPLKNLALIGGAWMLWSASRGATIGGRLFLAAFLVVGGIQHFVYASFVERLVPAWIPGRLGWAYFTGCALVAGGLATASGALRAVESSGAGALARVGVRLAALMIFLWVVLLHVPRVAANPSDPGELSGAFEALATSGVALLIAAREDRQAKALPLLPVSG
jgi:uncharacterized membrane protein